MNAHSRISLLTISLSLLAGALALPACEGPLMIIVGDDEWGEDDDLLDVSTETGHGLTVFLGEISGTLHHGAFVGDVDGDGYNDFILVERGGSSTAAGDAMGDLRGAIYLFYGRETFPSAVSVLDADLILRGASETAAGLGDIDGDGYADFAFNSMVGDAPDINDETDGFHLIYGDPVRYSGEYNSNDVGTILLSTAGNGSPDHFHVGTAGDVNGDGYPDSLFNVRMDENDWPHETWSHLVLGGSARLPQNYDLADSDAVFEGSDGTFEVALAAVGAGDMDGDGYDDLLVSLENEDPESEDWGRIALYHGGADGFSGSIGPAESDARAEWFSIWYALGGLGDLDEDGYDDVALATHARIPIEFGAEDRWTGSTDPEDISMNIRTDADDSPIGGLASGDFDGDGHLDLVVGYPGSAFNSGSSGSLHVLRGDGQRTQGEFMLEASDAVLHGLQRTHHEMNEIVEDRLGWGVDIGPSVNGDTYDDILVGAGTNCTGDPDGGRVFLIYGGPY